MIPEALLQVVDNIGVLRSVFFHIVDLGTLCPDEDERCDQR